jgi:hypothetical protein
MPKCALSRRIIASRDSRAEKLKRDAALGGSVGNARMRSSTAARAGSSLASAASANVR